MAETSHLRLGDVRAILRIVGECRDLGDDELDWRGHLIAELGKLTDADLGFSGEMVGCRALRPVPRQTAEWGWEHGFDRAEFIKQMALFAKEPTHSPALNHYFARLAKVDGVCHTRRDLIPDRSWYVSTDYVSINSVYGVDHMLWCFRSVAQRPGDHNSGVALSRSIGRRNFRPRDLVLVRETQAALTPLVGGVLARFDDPSVSGLAPRVRQVLACLLEGDGDKQIAVRLSLSVHTVNEYTKVIYQHFGVRARTELLALWVRRGWGIKAACRLDATDSLRKESDSPPHRR